MSATLGRRLVAEAGGAAFLLAAICGSATLAERLAQGNGAVALLATSIAVGAALLALALAFQDLSGAHFNPAVTLASALMHELSWREAGLYAAMQVFGALFGLGVVSVLFGDALAMPRDMAALDARRVELVAAFGLVAVIAGCRHASEPHAVASYTVAAVWATGTVYFANPAVTLALASAGLAPAGPAHVAGIVLAQLGGAAASAFFFHWILGRGHSAAQRMPIVALDIDRGGEYAKRAGPALALRPSPERVRRRAATPDSVTAA